MSKSFFAQFPLAWSILWDRWGQHQEGPHQIPGPARCLACQGEFYVFQDTVPDGGWGRCLHCNLAGDILDVAAHLAKTDWRSAATLLLPGLDVSVLVQEEKSPFRRIREIWKQLETQEPYWPLWDRWHWPRPVGETQSQNMYSCVRTVSRRVFKRFLWGKETPRHLLITPLEDWPGRICAFVLFWGRKADQWLYFSPVSSANYLPGVWGLGKLRGTRALVFLDVRRAISLQLRHLQEHDKPLPLLAVWPRDSPSPYLKQLGELVFWDRSNIGDLLRWAWPCRSRMSMLAPQAHSHKQPWTASHWVEMVFHKALPVPQALEKELSQAPVERFHVLLQQTGWTPADWEQVAQQSSASLRRFLGQASWSCCPITAGPYVAVADPDGWRNFKTGELLANAVFRIQRVRMTEEGEWYDGQVSFQGKTYSFSAPKSFAKRPLTWLAQFFLEKGIGVLTFSHFWQPWSLHAAYQLQKPEVVRDGPLGWDSLRGGWRLPQGFVAPAGKWEPLPEQTPWSPLPLADIPTWARTWITVTCYNLLAPTYGYQPLATAWIGTAAQYVETACRIFGYGLGEWSKLEKVPIWPHYIQGSPWQRHARWSFSCPEIGPYIQKVDWLAGQVLFIQGGWSLVLANNKDQSPLLYVPHLWQAVVGFLLWLSRRSLRRSRPNASPWGALLGDLETWGKELGGPTWSSWGHQVLWPTPEEQVRAWIAVAAHLYEEGLLSWRWLPFWGLRKRHCSECPLLYDPDRQVVWIAPASVNLALRRRGLPIIYLDHLKKILSSSSLVQGPHLWNSYEGWFVPETCWNEQIKQHRLVQDREQSRA
jgi:hypothetical protein